MKKVHKRSALNLSQEDVADQTIEDNPVFKAKIEKAFAEYKALGGLTVESLVNKLQHERRG
jgi:hypothetical protein